MKAIITEVDPDSNWVLGTIGKYGFEAKLFDEGSRFGINGGRVSILCLYQYQGQKECIASRDGRHWDTTPTAEQRKYFDAVLGMLENSPKRFS